MNKRKYETTIEQKQHKKLKNINGITLIALVITIIIMLILAGVSLNATIGENGIISKAKNTTYMQGIASLEEYLQTEYIKYYEETEEYQNKIELLASKKGDLLLKDGSKSYITYNGKMYYLINKQSLPDDVKNQLQDGNTSEYSKYIRLQDVYGVTSDLRVYYCSNGPDNVLGTTNNLEINPNMPLAKVNSNSELKSAITSALNEIGITVDTDTGVTTGNVANLKKFSIDGNETPISNLSGISELVVLQELELKNVRISNLDGIESCNMLKKICLEDCIVTEENGYGKISTVIDLEELYLKFSNEITEDISNQQIKNLSLAMSKAVELNKIERFGIVGTTDMITKRTEMSYDNDNGKYSYNSNTRNNVTDISGLSQFSDNIKDNMKIIYLNNNNLQNIDCLEGFYNIEELDIACNDSLKSLKGLENHNKLKYLLAQYTSLENIENLTGCTAIESVILRCTNLQSLKGIESTKLGVLDVKKSKLIEISDLKICENLYYLQLENNVNLNQISSIKNCIKINKLYLAGDINLDESVLASNEFQTIIKNCGNNYSLDGKYGLLFLNQEKIDLTNSNIDDRQLTLIKGKTNIKAIKLSGNSKLSNDMIEEILSSLVNLQSISLLNMSQVTSINFVKELKQLVELDLRGTSVENLSILENLANSSELTIGCLLLNNEKIDVSNIQKTISSVSENARATSYTFNSDSHLPFGIIITNKNCLSNFSKCTEITKFYVYNTVSSNVSGTTIDLSNCEKLKFVSTRSYNVKFILPTNLEIYVGENNNTPVLEGNLKLTNFNSTYNGASINIDSVLEDLKYNTVLREFGCGMGTASVKEIKNISYLKNKPIKTISFQLLRNLEKINVTEEIGNITQIYLKDCTSYNDINTFYNFTNLEILYLSNTKVSSLEGLRNHMALKNLNIKDTIVSSLSPLENVTTLNNIYASNSKISDLKGIENLINLENLDVAGNSISNLYYLGKLAEKNNIKLNYINLANNLLENNAAVSVDGKVINVNNIEIIEKLYKAGVRKIDISGNNFSDTSVIKNLKWESYKE